MWEQVSSWKVLDLGAVQISKFAKSSSSKPMSSTVPSTLYRTPVHPQPQQAGNTVFISQIENSGPKEAEPRGLVKDTQLESVPL